MRISRSAVVGALTIPLALAGAGAAFAAPGDNVQDQALGQGSALGQAAGLLQGNLNGSPVTQANPAINGSDIAGIGGFFDEGDTAQSIKQDNSVDSETEQGNKGRIDQGQASMQDASGEQGLADLFSFSG